MKEELLEEDFDEAKLEFRLRAADLPGLVRQFPHGILMLPSGWHERHQEGVTVEAWLF